MDPGATDRRSHHAAPQRPPSPGETGGPDPGSSTTGSSNATNRSRRDGRRAARDISLLFLLLFLLQVQPSCSLQDSCLECFNDLINNITCVWNVTCMTNWTGVSANTTFKLYGKTPHAWIESHKNASCDLKPVSDSDSARRSCSLVFPHMYFNTGYSIEVRLGQRLVARLPTYKIEDYVKMYPPERPVIENSTISWAVDTRSSSQYEYVDEYDHQLQWKEEKEPWKTVNLNRPEKMVSFDLDPDVLVRGARYQTRVRVRPGPESDFKHPTWSDWSRTASWESTVGKEMNQQQADAYQHQIVGVIGVLVLLIFTICYKTNKPTWVCIVKKVQGPPLPDPSKFFPGFNAPDGRDFHLWLSPKFTREESPLRPVDISPVEVTDTLDHVAPYRPEVVTALLDKNVWNLLHGSSSSHSSYSNESYSLTLCSLLHAGGGGLAPCATDSPYGPGGGKRGDAEEEEAVEEEEIDSGLGGEGEFSRDSLDVVDRPEEVGEDGETEGRGDTVDGDTERERDRGGEEGEDGEGEEGGDDETEGDVALRLLLSGDSVITGGNSVQMSPSYERVDRLQARHSAPEGPDPGAASSGDDQEGTPPEEGGEGQDADAADRRFRTHRVLQFDSCSSPLASPLPGFLHAPLLLPGKVLGPPPLPLAPPPLPVAPPPLPLEALALWQSSSMALEPSSGGYMPVKEPQA